MYVTCIQPTKHAELILFLYILSFALQLHAAQNNSITFLIARHPFERLLSAYRDKFVYAIPHSFHDKLGRKIVRTYRKKVNEMKTKKKFSI